MESGVRESTIATVLALNYVEYGSTLIFSRNIITEFCKPTILGLISVFSINSEPGSILNALDVFFFVIFTTVQ